MDSGERNHAFASFLSRLRSTGAVPAEDVQAIRRFPVHALARREVPLPQVLENEMSISGFVMLGNMTPDGEGHPMNRFETLRRGLLATGWSDWPFEVRSLGAGAFGSVTLVFKMKDVNQRLERRRFAALKYQPLEEDRVHFAWKEMAVLRAVNHPNIIDFYDAFIVAPVGGIIHGRYGLHGQLDESPKPEKQERSPDVMLSPAERRTKVTEKEQKFWEDRSKFPRPTSPPNRNIDQLWFVVEYADAGNMETEIKRYRGKIPEYGARYYMQHICQGLRYLHHHFIEHNDLHAGNVVLKYLPDGIRKKAMLCDFGLADFPKQRFRYDVTLALDVMYHMLTGVRPTYTTPRHVHGLSDEANAVLVLKPAPDTCNDLLAYEWFMGPTDAPVPGSDPSVVEVLWKEGKVHRAPQQEEGKFIDIHNPQTGEDFQAYLPPATPVFPRQRHDLWFGSGRGHRDRVRKHDSEGETDSATLSVVTMRPGRGKRSDKKDEVWTGSGRGQDRVRRHESEEETGSALSPVVTMKLGRGKRSDKKPVLWTSAGRGMDRPRRHESREETVGRSTDSDSPPVKKPGRGKHSDMKG